MNDSQFPKTIDDYFSDWESHAFGFGYGTGEPHVIPALRRFLECCTGTNGQYDYQEVEGRLGELPAWLFINRLCRLYVLEYGSSPRFAWLTDKGKRLQAFVFSKTDDELIELACRDSDYCPCYPDACNCAPGGYEKGRVCPNPFWRAVPQPSCMGLGSASNTESSPNSNVSATPAGKGEQG